MALDETFDNVLDIVNKIEKALYVLYKTVSTAGFKALTDKIPEMLKTTIQTKLKDVIGQVSSVVSQFLDGQVMSEVKGVLKAAIDVTQATMDLLPDTARTAAEKAERFMRAVVGLVTAGTDHIRAIIALIGAVVTNLGGGTASLEAATITTLKTNPLLLPELAA